jgi:hypothetical protein
MSSREDKLAAKVEAVNTANRLAWDTYHLLRGVFAPLVGEQVCKKDGGLLAKVQKLLPGLFPNTRELRVYRHSSEYHLVWKAWASKLVNGCVCSHEADAYVGKLTDGVLMELCEPFTGRTDWTAVEVVSKREAYEGAMRAADLIKSTLYPFGEYDT